MNNCYILNNSNCFNTGPETAINGYGYYKCKIIIKRNSVRFISYKLMALQLQCASQINICQLL